MGRAEEHSTSDGARVRHGSFLERRGALVQDSKSCGVSKIGHNRPFRHWLSAALVLEWCRSALAFLASCPCGQIAHSAPSLRQLSHSTGSEVRAGLRPRSLRPRNLLAMDSKLDIGEEDVDTVLKDLYGSERNPDFWSWREQARQASPVSSAAPFALDSGDLTYGEFDLSFFSKLLALACPQRGEVFCDVGSGCGRLAIAASLLYSSTLAVSRGVEISPILHQAAEDALQSLLTGRGGGGAGSCRTEFVLADVLEARESLYDVDVAFCYSTAFAASGPYLTDLSMLFGLALRPGARLITIDKMLLSDGPWEYELLHTVEGRNREVGTSTGYVWRLTSGPQQR